MTWLTNVPTGSLLPEDEVSRFQDNWDYIETNLQNDHFWDEGDDGFHKKVEMTSLDTAGVAQTNGDPNALSSNTIGMYYMKPKTATEAPEGQFNEPFYAQNVSATMHYKQLGMRAMGTFRVSGSAIVTNGGNNWDYMHNVGSITRNGTGNYAITFSRNPPNARYIVLATVENSISLMTVIQSKTNSGFTIRTRNSSNAAVDPTSVSFAVMGG